MKYWAFFPLILLSVQALSHPRDLDGNGGHNHGKTGEYHCHRAECESHLFLAERKSPSEQSREAIKEAERENRPFSRVYDRKEWPHWIDEDRDCQNTRAEILIGASQVPVKFRNEKKCSVISGRWHDPFSGKTWTDAKDIDIDHIVPLKWAHARGGERWPKALKRKFANDPENLLPVHDRLNQAKGDRGPSEWMPPNQAFRCEYLNRFNAVVTEYQLQPTPSERRIIDRIGAACSDQSQTNTAINRFALPNYYAIFRMHFIGPVNAYVINTKDADVRLWVV